ncbi:PASTA domain-containing protein [Blastococcus sp. CT_GayMR16]|uniref:PASTA domain-containing protein n=1 Tax=Blastococcus sp. CT_GayMR16 TaxID=2559607 RepID=UPI0010731EA5|nr:PASTA domain-containing protein [Blastococcus sp. CT_GayMR16]TFV86143.1 PASTA domain-containing protein [Blastococcus sp. CT_GayMR16]
MRSRSTGLFLTLLLSVLALMSGCAAEQVRLPDVVGLPLDEAHRVLEELGFEEFDDSDAFDERAIIRDANWVVLESDPAAGASVALDETVAFQVGKRDERRTVDLLPAGSPVAQEFAAQEAKEQEERAAQEARDAAEEAAGAQARAESVTAYINDVDPVLRLATNVFAEIDATADGVRSEDYGYDQSTVVGTAVDAATMVRDRVAGFVPPNGSRRAGTHEDLVAATQRWTDAARTLLSADGVGRESSLARYAEVRAEAQAAWNQALTALYDGTTVPPPLLP